MLALFSILILSTLCQANPYAGRKMYINPSFVANIQSSIDTTTDSTTLKNLKIAQTASSAYWLDVMAKVQPNGAAETILKDAASQNPVPVVTFIVYNLVSRDCSASSSNGEIQCVDSACVAGISTYQHQYIDPLVVLLKKYSTVPVVLVIEPDSLENLATNMGNSKCAMSANAYKTCITYAVNQLYLPNTYQFLSSGHSGWLGWTNNLAAYANVVNSMGILPKLRGFATNCANYQPLGTMCSSVGWCLPPGHPTDSCCADPCGLTTQYNGANNEMNYIQLLAQTFPGKTFITDTSRNAVNVRSSCSNWCNIKSAGLGLLPTANTGNLLIDAFLWLKTPGESDGCSPAGQNCTRYDYMCSSIDSLTPSPEAGKWFDAEIKMLAKNANFGSSISPTPSPVPAPTPAPFKSYWQCQQCKAI